MLLEEAGPAGEHEISTWFGNYRSRPAVVVRPETVKDIVAVMRDVEKYPAPVRAVGSSHSVSGIIDAEGGTAVAMRSMERILDIGPDTVTAEAGALYADVVDELRKRGLQFYVNPEIGNATLGSMACGGTKDASMPGEYGQVASFVSAMKLVAPSGEILKITEDEPELLRAARSSYGLFGIIYEVTFKVRPLRSMSIRHESYTLDEFLEKLEELRTQALDPHGESIMMYLDPFRDQVVLERRRYNEGKSPHRPSKLPWKIRNFVRKDAAPYFGFMAEKHIANPKVRYFLIDRFSWLLHLGLTSLVRGENTVAPDQVMRYPKKATKRGYVFSIWAFDAQTFAPKLGDYFEFCRAYYEATGYRCDVHHVGYLVKNDPSSLLSYSYDWDALTFDPICTGNPGWEAFYAAYNDFCSERSGMPFFNQTPFLTREQVQKAFGERLQTFEEYRKRFDPTGRLVNGYFEELLSTTSELRPEAADGISSLR